LIKVFKKVKMKHIMMASNSENTQIEKSSLKIFNQILKYFVSVQYLLVFYFHPVFETSTIAPNMVYVSVVLCSNEVGNDYRIIIQSLVIALVPNPLLLTQHVTEKDYQKSRLF
jgi:hypothetical protein